MVTGTFKKADSLFLWSILKKKKKKRRKEKISRKILQVEGKIGREYFQGLDADLEGERAKWCLKKDRYHLQVGRMRGVKRKVRVMEEGKWMWRSWTIQELKDAIRERERRGKLNVRFGVGWRRPIFVRSGEGWS